MRIPLILGDGLDRESGAMIRKPGTIHDLRNVYTQEGKLVVRRGLHDLLTLERDEVEVDGILAIQDLPQEGVRIAVAWDLGARQLLVYRIIGDFESSDLLAVWATLSSEAGDDPKVSMVEVGSQVFMAHDEPRQALRAPTFVYNPFAGTVLAALQADVTNPEPDPGDYEDVAFRGVTEHLGYLFGWGFGTADTFEPHLVRVSEPKEPNVFYRDAYFLAKPVNEPVIRCSKAHQTLLIFKESRTLQVIGSERADFGLNSQYDTGHGLLASALGVSVLGDFFGWSHDGPRVWSDAGPSQALDMPLGLLAAQPDDLAEQAAAGLAYATYIPRRRVVLFVFGELAYALSLWNPQDPRWSYWPMGANTGTGALVRVSAESLGGVIAQAPTGYPDFVSAEPGATDVTVAWNNVDQTGGEFCEIWIQPTGGDWVQVASDLVGVATAQERFIEDLEPATTYFVALRYRRGGLYGTGYTSADPADWPAVSKGSFQTVLAAPVLTSAVWSRTSAIAEQVLVSVEVTTPGVDVEIYRDDGGGPTLVHTENEPAIDFTWADTGISGESTYTYHALHAGPAGDSANSNQIELWTGPAPPPQVWALVNGEDPGYGISWNNGGVFETEVWDTWERPAGPVGALALVSTEIAGTPQYSELLDAAADGETLEVRIRHVATAFGVDDFSDWASGPSEVII